MPDDPRNPGFEDFWRVDSAGLTLDSALVQLAPAADRPGCPAVVTPVMDGVDLAAWLTEERAQTRTWLHQYGAILFRGFDHAASAEAFQTIRTAAIPEPMDYRDRSSPRTEVAHAIYTSTDYPPEYAIAMHSELSYSQAWPRRLAFFCVHAAAEGGATPLASTRLVLSQLHAATRDRFASLGVRYTRRLNPRIGLSWQQVYGTTDRSEVEAHCRRSGIELVWTGDDALTVHWQRPAICRHPETDEEVWFNHALFFNTASLDAEVARALGSASMPFETCYGDGSPIATDTIAEIAAAYQYADRAFDWKPGDVLLVDNLLMAHGRRPYRGERLILVAMGS